jgi:hypothetical protein
MILESAGVSDTGPGAQMARLVLGRFMKWIHLAHASWDNQRDW